MKYSLDTSKHLLIIWVDAHGPEGMLPIKMAIDTGATRTCISPEVLHYIGYHPEDAIERIEIGTGNGTISVPIMPILAVRCLGRTMENLRINWLTLPEKSGIDGLLGLDFLRNGKLHIDFEEGTVELD